jgi:hypothetical protein
VGFKKFTANAIVKRTSEISESKKRNPGENFKINEI